MPLRERKEVQEMLRNCQLSRLFPAAICLLAAAVAQGAVWPDQFAKWKKVESGPAKVADQPLWDEYGLQLAEQARFADGARQFTGTAYRCKDSTGAFAAFQWQRPADARPSKLVEASAETPNGVMLVYGNYFIAIQGWKPKLDEVALWLLRLPGLDQSALPTIYLPSGRLVPNSQRYVIGPTSLERFEKGVSPSLAAFSMGAEAQIGQYQTPAGQMQLAVFSYPTPHIARDRHAAFTQVPGAMVKRAGPLVAVLLSPPNPDEAEKLLASVKYNATVTSNERLPTPRDNVGDLLLNIFILVGIILAVIVPVGIAFGILRRLGLGTSSEAMTVLHLEDRTSVTPGK